MDAKSKRRHLADFADANRDIELIQTAIDILERLDGVSTSVKFLKRRQVTCLRRIDAAAKKLGAPYVA